MSIVYMLIDYNIYTIYTMGAHKKGFAAADTAAQGWAARRRSPCGAGQKQAHILQQTVLKRLQYGGIGAAVLSL